MSPESEKVVYKNWPHLPIALRESIIALLIMGQTESETASFPSRKQSESESAFS